MLLSRLFFSLLGSFLTFTHKSHGWLIWKRSQLQFVTGIWSQRKSVFDSEVPLDSTVSVHNPHPHLLKILKKRLLNSSHWFPFLNSHPFNKWHRIKLMMRTVEASSVFNNELWSLKPIKLISKMKAPDGFFFLIPAWPLVCAPVFSTCRPVNNVLWTVSKVV